MEQTDKVKVCVVGSGGWGFNHARAYYNNEKSVLCAVSGRSKNRTAARAEYFHVPGYTDVEEMLEKEKPDFVSVCLPAMDTFGTTMKVINAGIPLLVEKPIAYQLEEARAMIDAAQAKDLFMGIDFNQRFSIPARLARKAQEEGKLGDMNYAVWRFGHDWGDTMAHPHANLIEAQCHGFNFLEAFCGPIESVMAEMSDKSGKKGYSTFILTLRFVSGALGSMICTFDASGDYPLCQTIELNGRKGRVLIEDNAQKYTYQSIHSAMSESWAPGFFMDDERSFSHNTDRLIDATLSAFIKGEKPPVPAAEGLRALELAYAAIESYEKGIRVRIRN